MIPEFILNWVPDGYCGIKSNGSLFLWLACHERLKTKALLFARSILSSPHSEFCDASVESALHAILDIPAATGVWQAVISAQFSPISDFWLLDSMSSWVDWNLAYSVTTVQIDLILPRSVTFRFFSSATTGENLFFLEDRFLYIFVFPRCIPTLSPFLTLQERI